MRVIDRGEVREQGKTLYQKEPRKIEVKYIDTGQASLRNGEFKCDHINIEIDEPCCSVVGGSGYIECGCGGEIKYYCPDCNNKDLEMEDN